MGIYSDGTYLQNNPTWHLEDAAFKAKYIHRMIQANGLKPARVAEIGCGAGGVLNALAALMADPAVRFDGFDISHDAIEMARTLERQNGQRENVKFTEGDLLASDETFDLLLVIDVFEHVPNYLDFIERCRGKARYKMFHIPLEVHVSSVLRGTLTSARASVGHLHYFSRESALATVQDAGHRIVDSTFTPGAIELYREHPSLKRAVANAPRWIAGLASDALAARLFGGYSLLVLAE